MSIHRILDLNNWDFFYLEHLLTNDSSSANEIDETGLSPLYRVLADHRCSPRTVKLLVEHGADVNFVPNNGCSPLIIALSRRLDKAIIRELLDGGIDHTKIKKRREFVLCMALYHGNSVDVFKMLLDEGFAMHDCSFHPSLLHCALEPPFLDPDILKLVLEKCPDVDMNLLNTYDQSLFCLALRGSQRWTIVEMLLEAGCATDVCLRHASLWLCATSYSSLLTLEAVKFVSSHCPPDHFGITNDFGENPLQLALKYGGYEMAAVRFLLRLQTGDVNSIRSDYGNGVLHDATSNCLANPSAIKLLIRRGADVNVANRRGETPLHTAVACDYCKQTIVRILIENGAQLNVENRMGQTPLYIAAQKGLFSSTIQLLLSKGARIKADTHWDPPSLRWVLEHYDSLECEDNIVCCKMFLKYALLDVPKIDVKELSLTIYPRAELMEFAEKCANELHEMKFIHVSRDLTLFEFIWRCFYESESDDVSMTQLRDYDLIHLLQVLQDKKFPLYFDAVAANIGRKALKARLHSLRMYTNISSPDTPSVERKITLNYESIRHIVKFLRGNEDVLSLIVAFHKRKQFLFENY